MIRHYGDIQLFKWLKSQLKELLAGVIADWLTDRPKNELMILEAYCKKAILFQSVYEGDDTVEILAYIYSCKFYVIASFL